MPAKRFDSVSCRARATARPPTPSAVRIGVTAMPRELSSTRPPTTRTTRRTDVRKSPVTPTASARRSLAAATSESSAPATVMVTDRMIAASSTAWIWTARRGGSSAISMATKRPSTTHQSSDGRRIAWRTRLSPVARWPVQRRKPRISAFRKSSAATVTTTRATTGQKSRGHKARMRVHAIVGLTQALRQFSLSFGFLVGFAAGAFYAPLTATTTRWFTARRGLAVALVSAGIGLGILIVAPLARALTSAWDWRVAMLVLGDLAWLVIVPVALLLREPATGAVASDDAEPGAQRDYTTREVLAAPQFWAIALTHFACCAAHSGPIFHMVTHATDQGVAAMAAATVFGVSGLASIVGRIGGGLLADRFGAKPTLIAGLAVQAAMIFGYLFARDLGSFVALALVFGTAYGGVMPLYALVTREYFGEKVMGSAYGAVFLISTLGMGLGSFAGGVIYDRLGSYVWLFLASFAIGTMAVVLAFTFRRPRLPALALTEAAAAR